MNDDRFTQPDPDTKTADLLSRVLNAEAERVEPTPGGLQMIQQRTQQRPRGRAPWMLGTLGAGLATAAVITAIVVAGNNGSSNGSEPPIVDQPTETTLTQQPQMHDGVYDPSADPYFPVSLWLVGPQPPNKHLPPRLYPETHTVSEPVSTPLLTALNELLTSRPIDPDLHSYWPEGIYATGVIEEDGGLTVHLAGDTGAFNGAADGDEGRLAVEAALRTMGYGGVVRFDFNGEPMATLLGVDVSDGVTAAPEDEIRAWITIDNIVDGQTVENPVTVDVSGNVFEGNVNWILADAGGTTLDEGFVTTAMGEWMQVPVDLGSLDPGEYLFTALEYSPEDGSPINVDSKHFVVE